MKNKKVKGCGKMFLCSPDPLICGQNIKTSEGKIKWYCDKCLK